MAITTRKPPRLSPDILDEGKNAWRRVTSYVKVYEMSFVIELRQKLLVANTIRFLNLINQVKLNNVTEYLEILQCKAKLAMQDDKTVGIESSIYPNKVDQNLSMGPEKSDST